MKKFLILCFCFTIALQANTLEDWFVTKFDGYKNVLVKVSYTDNSDIYIQVRNKKGDIIEDSIKLEKTYIYNNVSEKEKRLVELCLPNLFENKNSWYIKYSTFCKKRFDEDGYKTFLTLFMRSISKDVSTIYNMSFNEEFVSQQFQVIK